MMIESQRILLVSDAGNSRMRRVLEKHGFKVSLANCQNADKHLAKVLPDLLIIDLADPTEAVELIRRVRGTVQSKNLLVMAVAEWGTGQATLSLSHGADAFEPKPIDGPRLVAAVEKLLIPRMVLTANASTAKAELSE
jgi:DNA-binding response OmpR family regulator